MLGTDRDDFILNVYCRLKEITICRTMKSAELRNNNQVHEVCNVCSLKRFFKSIVLYSNVIV